MYTKYVSVVLALVCTVTALKQFHPLSDEFIDHINKKGKWKAGRNFHPDTPISYIKTLMGTNLKHERPQNILTVEHELDFINNLPDSFDPRDVWPNCSSLHEIRDQGSCGSCWAVGAVSAMTDRVCTYSNGSKNFHFSAEDLLTCSDDGGCGGGDPYSAWYYWVQNGIVSGGNYNSHAGCKPYSSPACEHHTSGNRSNCTESRSTPPCERQCEKGYKYSYEKDKRYGKKIYTLKGEDNIKAELFKNGPVEVSFTVYMDFINYKSGVYSHVDGEFAGGHAVKMMGWGEENGNKYWLIANSWNTDWGDKGFFKILRGVDECGIESEATAGDLSIEDY